MIRGWALWCSLMRYCRSALLTVLQDATIDLRQLEGDDLADRAKYAELVMKVRAVLCA